MLWFESNITTDSHDERVKYARSKVKKTIEACRDTGYLERDAFERAIPVSIPLEEKKKEKNSNDH